MKKFTFRIYGFLKIVLSSFLVCLSLWALLLPPIFPTSSRSIANAKGTIVEAAMGGEIYDLAESILLSVDSGERIAGIRRREDGIARNLRELAALQQNLEGQTTYFESIVELRRQGLEQLKQELATVHGLALGRLKREYNVLKSQVDFYSKDLVSKRNNQERVQPLYNEGIISELQWTRALNLVVEAEQRVELARNTLLETENELNSAGIDGGVFASGADRNILREIESYRHEIEKMEHQKAGIEDRKRDVAKQIVSWQNNLEDDEKNEVLSPFSGVVWQKKVTNGQNVTVGQEVALVADEHSIFIEAYFNVHYLNRISNGDLAHVFVLEEDRFIEGRVMNVEYQEQGPYTVDVINTVPPDRSMLKVIMAVDVGTLSAKHIGQLTQVIITKQNPGFVTRGLVWLSFALKRNYA